MTIRGDSPIIRPEDDALGRAKIAASFARHVRSLDASEGLVVGVLGAWGSGKTSFVNLAREKFGMAGATILDFNPWMFSGAEQLVESFFVELAAQLRLRPGLTQLGKDLQDYGEMFSGMAWVPLVGPWIERGRGATKILAKILQRRKEGIGGRRTQLERALAALTQPIIVVLDDIDRLSTSEIRDVFKLVRLTASFPNVIYILAFDRHRVESALAEQGVPGRDYLEKILQLAVDLPAIPPQLLSRQLSAAIDGALADVQNPGPFDEQVWPDIFIEVIRPLIRNMRDTRRYSVAIAGTVIDLEGEVALADVLALEAVRIFLPDVFGCLHSSVEGLTTVSGRLYGAQDPPQLKVQVDRVIESSGTHEVLVRAMIHRLFPAGERHIGGSAFGSDFKGRWLTERRVAHEDILRYYLERIAGEGMHAFTDSEQAWAIIGDRKGLEAYLRSLDRERLQDVIASLESYEERFQPAHVVPGSIVLLNLLPDLPAREQGLFDPDSRLVVARVVLRLLRSLGDSAAVEAAVREILPEVTSLPSKLELINLVGYREGVGHKLVSEPAAAEFARSWRDQVREASVDELIGERDLLRVLLRAKHDTSPGEELPVIDRSPRLTLAILRAARTEVRSQDIGNRSIRRSPRLAWDALIDIYGGEAVLKERIDELRATLPEGNDDLIQLVDKYLGGWRSDDRDD